MWLRRVISCCLLASAGCGATTVAEVAPSPPRALDLTRRLPTDYREVCAEQLAYAPAGAGACPPLIPGGRLKVIDATPFSKRKAYRGGYLADFSSASLNELGGRHIETNGGHWHYSVAWTPSVRRLLVHRGVERPGNASKPSKCRQLVLHGEPVEACRVVPYEQGGGLNGGHIAYVWTHGRVTYVVSLHGYANEPRARAMTLALMAQAR